MNPALSVLDWVVVLAYLGVVALVGFRASGHQKSTRDYFLGGRSLPWWAATLSIIATETSAVTYIGTPRIAYEGDWSFLQLILGFAAGRVFLALFFVKVFYRHEIITVYGFLERRFGSGARTTAASLFLLGRVIASGVRLFAGCLALEVATGLPLNTSVFLLGGFATVYTFVGGIRAVVWTDVLLGLTFMAGGIVSAAYLLANIPGGVHGLLDAPLLSQKTTVFHVAWDLVSSNTLVAGILGGFFLTLATHGTDQDIVQRILTCRDSKGGSLSILGSAFLILPLMALFLAVGTLLHFYYVLGKIPPPQPSNPDHVFPLFIVKELPAGFSGFVMAGLFAASISSFASVLNALASTTVSDFYRPFCGRLGVAPSERHLVRFSKGSTLFWGFLLILVAMGFQGSESNVIEVALRSLTYFYGALLGTFLLGIFTQRGTSSSTILGMLASVPLVLLLQVRQFLDRPSSAPGSIRALLSCLPEWASRELQRFVPDIAWPYWIILGAAVSFVLGGILSGERGGGRLTAPDSSSH